jgi:hypothetical protein
MIIYNIVKKSSIHYKELMCGEAYRENLIDPILLITDTEKYYGAKKSNDLIYKNLCDIVFRMKELYNTGEDKYHAFGNYLREVEDAGFDINAMKAQNTTGNAKLHDQIELIRMLMCFKYMPVL